MASFVEFAENPERHKSTNAWVKRVYAMFCKKGVDGRAAAAAAAARKRAAEDAGGRPRQQRLTTMKIATEHQVTYIAVCQALLSTTAGLAFRQSNTEAMRLLVKTAAGREVKLPNEHQFECPFWLWARAMPPSLARGPEPA